MRQKTAFLAAIILSFVAGGTLLAQGYNEDAAISRAFRSVLHRDPYPMEVRRYRILMDENPSLVNRLEPDPPRFIEADSAPADSSPLLVEAKK